MKRIFYYISMVAAAAFAASCTAEQFTADETDGVVTLRLQTADLETRASATEENENTLTHADFFFFSDEAGTTLLNHTRLEVKDGELVSKGNNLYEYTFGELEDGNPLQGPSYVYVIANYPETISETTLDDILGLDIKTDLSANPEYFVMDSYESASSNRMTYLKPSKAADSKTYTIGLTRAAAKLALTINVANSFEDEAGNVWTPETSQMWVNYLYARKNAVVAAEPVAFDEKANYFNTAQETPTSAGTTTGATVWTTTPVYTYPVSYETSDVTAPYYKIFCPWKCEKKGLNNFYYKIILPDLGSFQRNKVYNLTVNLSVIGGTEDDWALVTDHIYVADWWAPEAIETSFEGAMYLDVPVKSYEIYGVDYIDIPVVSSNDIQVINVTGTKTNLYNGNTVSVTPSITNVTKEGFRLTHELNDDITSTGFDCTPITYIMTVKHTEGGLSKTVNVTVVQYPSVYAEAELSNGIVFVNGQGYNDNYRHTSGSSYATPVFDNTESSGTWYSGYVGNIGSVTYPSRVDGSGDNNNQHQYTIHASVLPPSNTNVIGDPRGGSSVQNLGYSTYTFTNGTAQQQQMGGGYRHRRYFNSTTDNNVSSKYNPAGDNTQNIIAPAFKIASSYGKTTLLNYENAKERCAAYQENGYPAGRWRLPTAAEIDFVISLSENNHIPTLFGCGSNYNDNGSFSYFAAYWSGGGWAYCGKTSIIGGEKQLDLSTGGSKTSEGGTTYTVTVPTSNGTGYTVRYNNTNYTHNIYTRCVYDVWYWGEDQDSAHMTTWGGFQMD